MTYCALLVIGGGPAGLAAAKGYREAGGAGPVAILSTDQDPPYARPPLSKDFLRGESSRADLPLVEASWYTDNDVELHLRTEATALNPATRSVTTRGGGQFTYQACVLALGSEPIRIPVPGADDPRVHVLRSIADSEAIAAQVQAGTRVAVIGTGFIGCEVAASCARRGARVTIIGRDEVPQQDRLGREVGERIAAWLRADGVELRMGAQASAIRDASVVELEGGGTVEADVVVIGGGVRQRAELAEQAGLQVRDGRVVVDSRMRTSADGVWCAGDLALAHNVLAGRQLVVEHWGEAEAMGEVAGRDVAGAGEQGWAQAPGFWSTIGDRTLKYVAWGDGFDQVTLSAGPGVDAFTAWYGKGGEVVGVLTVGNDDDNECGRTLVESHAPWPPRPSR